MQSPALYQALPKRSYPSAEQQVLMQALELTWNPGYTQKIIVAP